MRWLLGLGSDVVSESNVKVIPAIRCRQSLSSRNRWCIGILGLALLSGLFGSIGIGGRAVCIGFRLVGGSRLPTWLLAGRLLVSRVQYNTRGIDDDAGIVIAGRVVVFVLELRGRRCCLRTGSWW